ncbi:Uncharacterized membrane protein YgdD, TMEM256/DUF423 family [Atopomonas hussainii]|uniref:Uncharacterized membrane protein YgdD, TMEM256/DUF423 family n=1 Tax=Atopomonas hussainii TaxID=1429083 RepID=A0A1H7IAP4_9GAMM|nr:DUF423 domain-containing protein [Atopomonas hussainii]SEK58922.1 Uncharacterized membrane protein YgdD, TMEM256/DUF423 family [Atopomonas hussainii]
MQRWALLVAAVAGFLAVGLGAFAAHGLRNVLSAEYLTVFQTGVHYQMVHALALLAVAMLLAKNPARSLRIAAWGFTLGILLFSGSLYALTLSGVRSLGMITPFGGVAFLIGWASLAWFAWRSR